MNAAEILADLSRCEPQMVNNQDVEFCVVPRSVLRETTSLIAIMAVALEQAVQEIHPPTTTARCHDGICKMEQCARCQRAKPIYNAYKRAVEGTI